jgi:CTP synthase (UTP-ammonia lyase)
MRTATISLIGDHDPSVTAHRAIPRAIGLAGAALGTALAYEWVGTETLAGSAAARLAQYDAIWCVPASPYASMEGALQAIRYARETARPYLGTCGGFQHAVLEFARNVLRVEDAGHAEINPAAHTLVVTPLTCALVERSGRVQVLAGSRAAALCGGVELEETYHCSYGLNPEYEGALEDAGLAVTGRDPAGEPRIIELRDHPFFVATLFQPERAALQGRSHPLIVGFAAAALQQHREGSPSPTPVSA